MAVKVRALKTFASPGIIAAREGDEFELSAAQAEAWTRAGLVRPVAPEIRTATMPPAETTAARKRAR